MYGTPKWSKIGQRIVAYCGVYLNGPLRHRDRSIERSNKRSNERSQNPSNDVHKIVLMNVYVTILMNVPSTCAVRVNGLVNDLVNVDLSDLVNVHLNGDDDAKARSNTRRNTPQYDALFLTTLAFHSHAL